MYINTMISDPDRMTKLNDCLILLAPFPEARKEIGKVTTKDDTKRNHNFVSRNC